MKKLQFNTSQLYGQTGYFTPSVLIPWCLENKICRCTVIGGRGTGKTIGTLMWLLSPGAPYFAYSRRYAWQIANLASKDLSPLKAVNRNLGSDFMATKVSRDFYGIFEAEYMEDGRMRMRNLAGDCKGLLIPISTGAGLKGFDGLDIDVWVSDEIVPDTNESVLKEEGGAYRSIYETINRNRESEGRPPLLQIAYGNSNKVATPYTIEFGYIPHFIDMKNSNETARVVNGNELLILMDDSPIMEEKAKQAVYAGRKDKYALMAVANEFTDDHFSKIRRISHKELIPMYKLGDLYISTIKAGGWYVSLQNPGGNPQKYDATPIGIEKFRKQRGEFIVQYWWEKIIFSEELSESLLQEYFHLC